MKRFALLLFVVVASLCHPLFAASTWTDPNTNITWTYELVGDQAWLSTFTLTKSPFTEGDLAVPDFIAGYPVVGIRVQAFRDCTLLTSITLPPSVKQIESGAFYGCTNVTSINIPDGVTTIESSTFYGCTSLLTIDLPETLTTLASSAFSHSGIVHLDIPNGVTEIPENCFYECKALQSISLPPSLTKIHSYAFSSCDALAYLAIPEGVTEIVENVLRLSAPTTVIAPKSLTNWNQILSDNPITLYAYCPPPSNFSIPDNSTVFYTREYSSEWKSFLEEPRHLHDGYRGGLMSDHVYATVKVTVIPASAGSWSFENTELAEGEPLTIKAEPREGYIFMGWSSSEANLSSTDATFTFAAPKSLSLIATFLPKAVIEGIIDQRLEARIDGESLLTKEQVDAKVEAAIKEKKASGELFDQTGVNAKIEETISGKIENKELVTRESIQEMALGTPVIEVEGAQAQIGISLEKTTSLDGEWSIVTPEASQVEEDGTVKVSVKADDGTAFYKFVVPDGVQTSTK